MTGWKNTRDPIADDLAKAAASDVGQAVLRKMELCETNGQRLAVAAAGCVAATHMLRASVAALGGVAIEEVSLEDTLTALALVIKDAAASEQPTT